MGMRAAVLLAPGGAHRERAGPERRLRGEQVARRGGEPALRERLGRHRDERRNVEPGAHERRECGRLAADLRGVTGVRAGDDERAQKPAPGTAVERSRRNHSR